MVCLKLTDVQEEAFLEKVPAVAVLQTSADLSWFQSPGDSNHRSPGHGILRRLINEDKASSCEWIIDEHATYLELIRPWNHR